MVNIEIEIWNATPEVVQHAIVRIAEELSATCQVLASEREIQTRLSQQIEVLKKQNQQVINLTKTLQEVIKKNQSPKQEKNKQVVLVSDYPPPRLAKIAYGLTQAGWEVILLYKDKLEYDISFFSAIYQYTTAEEAVLLASLFSPVTYHVFSSWNYDTAIRLIDAKIGKITFDNYDQFGGMMLSKWEQIEHYQNLTKEEKYCIENADAICNRALSLQVAKRQLNYKLTKPRIFFPDYCWDKSFTLKPKLTDGIHVVFPGNFSTEQFHASPSLSIFDKEFIESLSARKIHYHIYPSLVTNNEVEFQERYKDFIELSNTNKFFHFHHYIPPEELISEISQYHVGITSRSKISCERGDTFNNPSAMKYFCSNKAFDFLDAGLDVIFGGSQLMEWLLKRSAGCHGALSEDIGPILEQKTVDDYKSEGFEKQISDGRKKLSISRHIPRLISFYESI
jgi:hypothetical protein